jgi:pimeloyl-ACP methyl ester carboxylesterase
MLAQQRCTEAGALLVAHSYGSVYASVLAKRQAALVRGLVLVEPAAVVCHGSKMTACFLYSLGAQGFRSPLSMLFRAEPGVANTLRRHFDFSRYILFLDEIKAFPAAVLVSKGDTLMQSDEILDHAAKAKNPLVTALAFDMPLGATKHQEHGEWCHNHKNNETVFELIQDISYKGRK